MCAGEGPEAIESALGRPTDAEIDLASDFVTPISDFKLQSRLLWKDSPVNLTVKGVVLEAQFELRNRYLLATTEGLPFEEGLHFYLLNSSFKVLDEVEVSAMYVGGIFSHVSLRGEATMEFSFFGNDRWRLTVLDRPRSWVQSLTMLSAKRQWRKLLSARYLLLKRLEQGTRQTDTL